MSKKNIYDNFRSIQGVKNSCYDKRSAAFILTGKLSQDIYHQRTKEDIKGAIVFNYKEGPDDAIVFTFIEDDLLKADYFTFDNVNYLVYSDVKLTDDEVDYRKQRAVECNVTFTHNAITYNGYFTSSIRTITENEFVGSQAVMPDETPLLILPTNVLTIGDRFTIEGKPFKIQEFDSITNKGISYLYLERDYVAKDADEVIEVAPEYVVEEETLTQDILVTPLTLRPMIEYTFTTEGGYFASTPRVDIISRKVDEVIFRVPFGIESVTITTKESATEVELNYEVVL